ncbi:diguanylate cyclase/phosphodiesterase [Halothece sp. PCC 7418]|uniref:bifunctional diguanylate cyclase/phosphodiesterase n=1 Tax=Halothece sp. (strain PCC 7418) TaxID=65093 RepID=UPI0002A06285|nr:EAL domain-containing protein [Halothece sp. PCC 7418]AFZ43631.1 diguanylate cyclase/phosphodiesterase [Halothece sp. PCC 7418]
MAKYFLNILLLTLVIFLAARLGLQVSIAKDNISLLWPPTGISIAVLLLQGRKLWPSIFLGIAFATAATGIKWGFIFAAALTNTVEALLATQLIHYWQVDYKLERIYDVLKLLVIILIITPLMAGLMGATGFCLNFTCSPEMFFDISWKWWVGNAMGALVITPLLLTWSHPQFHHSPPSKQAIVFIITGFALLISTNLLVFGRFPITPLNLNYYPLQYLCFPFLIWAAFSLKEKGATLAIFLTVIIAIEGTLQGDQPFGVSESVHSNLLILWSFMLVVSIPTLILASAVSERDFAEEQLSILAYQDPLTHLPNRSAFYREVSNFLSSCQVGNTDQACAILFIDLNRFKEINDSFGHTLGDQLLCQVSQKVKGSIPQAYIMARLGGDEFAVLVPSFKGYKEIEILTQDILKQFESSFVIESCEFIIGATIGIVIGNCSYTKAEDIIRDADIAMYHAKTSNRKSCYFDPLMRQKVISRLKLEQELRRGIDNNELNLVYQPIVNILNQKIMGFEALLRWYHPERGWVSPGRFIPIAEETELIVEIGDWVLTQACQQLQQWQENFSTEISMSLSVNVSPKQLRENDLVAHVNQMIKLYDIDPENLNLEITETAILESNSKQVLDELKALGVRLYLDDFGIGESSLSRLYQLPLDVIKIDRSFVQGIPENRRKSAIAQTIINLADNMDLGVIAEGIETEAQKKELLKWGCLRGQGFFFSKPVSAEVATDLIANNHLS